MADLELIGPSRAVSAKEHIGAEIFYTISNKSKRRKVSEYIKVDGTELQVERVQWRLDNISE